MRSTDDIINKEFSHSFMGYDMREVDFFLDEIIDRFEKLEAERKEMLSAMEYLLKRVEALGGGENGERRKLAAAEGAYQRLKAAAVQSVSAGPVRVQAGSAGAREPERHSEKKRVRPVPAPPAEPVPEPEVLPSEPEETAVAIEMETEAFAPNLEELFPELLSDMEAVMDAGMQPPQQEPEQNAEEKRA